MHTRHACASEGLSHEAIPAWQNKFQRNLKDFKLSIDKHFKKIDNPTQGRPILDYVVIDYKYLDEISTSLGFDVNYLKDEIDLYIETKFPQYNNYLIKLNY